MHANNRCNFENIHKLNSISEPKPWRILTTPWTDCLFAAEAAVFNVAVVAAALWAAGAIIAAAAGAPITVWVGVTMVDVEIAAVAAGGEVAVISRPFPRMICGIG